MVLSDVRWYMEFAVDELALNILLSVRALRGYDGSTPRALQRNQLVQLASLWVSEVGCDAESW